MSEDHPGGVLAMSDIAVERRPRTLSETLAGLMNMRLWGLRRDSMISTATIVSLARAAGFTTVLLIARKP